ncbi:MAG: AmmeMemoRadiSam system protein A [Sandaracinaceae bacterium]|jgi:AmmeMemoRadiSam system protein A|nr:AmmeMemoRadiSam system protein A [Sandaracinaceae bacterium]MBK7151689.1 AmmeMemoRadiSam system protein A [Sandaracinaceae bacterium]MBK8411343.1 AmmeMemoRadiSam system protein A [Sandaracinaceae bacterium]MBK8592655.1 AmmeMemoRadiSam system protein A [Sandaracinaceae bacterium]
MTRATATPDEQALLNVARDAIAARLEGRTFVPPHLPASFGDTARAVFVTLRQPGGELRGCVGRLEPSRTSLAHEIAESAISAALEDPRFLPVSRGELDGLTMEISLLEPPEPARGLQDLDPKHYGVVVHSGQLRGVLLPDIEGVDSAEQQVNIARMKARISPAAEYQLERFRVRKVPAGG